MICFSCKCCFVIQKYNEIFQTDFVYILLVFLCSWVYIDMWYSLCYELNDRQYFNLIQITTDKTYEIEYVYIWVIIHFISYLCDFHGLLRNAKHESITNHDIKIWNVQLLKKSENLSIDKNKWWNCDEISWYGELMIIIFTLMIFVS